MVCRTLPQGEWLRPENVPHWQDWDAEVADEALIHRIHPYPAKFPAHIPSRAFAHAERSGVHVKRVGDIFCGCGTVAIESRRRGFEFWGCDINPVAALIARVKSHDYLPREIAGLGLEVSRAYESASDVAQLSALARSALLRWFTEAQFRRLAKLLNAIYQVAATPGRERELLECAFSAIVKATSQWKPRSTKPAHDVTHVPGLPLPLFRRQLKLFESAWAERERFDAPAASIEIANATKSSGYRGQLDLLITSPPYATSYEYADLHQLSLLWLGFLDDHRQLRPHMVGSAFNRSTFASQFKKLNRTATHLSFSMFGRCPTTAAALATYYLDMQAVAEEAFTLVAPGGMAMFVTGNTRIKGVELDNAKQLAEALTDAGFSNLDIGRRKISNKKNTPHRHSSGRLSNDPTDVQVYAHEYILIAEKT